MNAKTMNDNDTVAVNKTSLIKFMEAFVEHGYGKTQKMSVPDEWSEIIDIACNVRSSSMKEQTMNDNAAKIAGIDDALNAFSEWARKMEYDCFLRNPQIFKHTSAIKEALEFHKRFLEATVVNDLAPD